MKQFEIEKGIPIPTNHDHSENVKYPFLNMEIGDSFFVPNVSKSFSIYTVIRNFNYRNNQNIKVKQRREANGVRVWRIR